MALISNIWIFSVEPIETRYTGQWHTHVPFLLKDELEGRYNVFQIDGVQRATSATPGAFLNFADTNYWKSSQLLNFLDEMEKGNVSATDHIICTDAWNPVILQLRYMNDLLGYNWTIHGMYHAGNYDPADILGQKLSKDGWVGHAEKSMFDALDYAYFATDFHIDMFCNALEIQRTSKIIRSGWPFEYLRAEIRDYANVPKKNQLVFPHRISNEKQVEIFKDLAKQLPRYSCVVCQETKLTKDEYHRILGESKIVFSANLQETLGISTCAEGPLTGCIPVAPNRLSYSEIFNNYPDFMYPSEWTESWDQYLEHRDKLVQYIKNVIENYDTLSRQAIQYINTDYLKYFHADDMITNFRRLAFKEV